MKKPILLFVLIFTAVLFAQEKEFIKSSDLYYCGEGKSSNEDEASNNALSDLCNNISVFIKSQFSHTKIDTNKKISETVKSIIETYSLATLNDVNTLPPDYAGGEVTIFKYIKKSEVEKIFNRRVQKVRDLYSKAREFEQDREIGFALKNYYFCIILINSIPARRIDFNGVDLSVEIPVRINKLLSSIRYQVIDNILVSEKIREVSLEVKLNGKFVQQLDFSFWSGDGWPDASCQGGEGRIRLFAPSVIMKELRIKTKYYYYECRKQHKELVELWGNVITPSFSNEIVLNLSAPKEITEANVKLALDITENCNVSNEINKESLIFLEAINDKDYKAIHNYFGRDLFLLDRIKRFIDYNNPTLIDTDLKAKLNKTFAGWELRYVRILNNYSSIRKQATEYLILDFDKDGHLNDFSIGLRDNLYEAAVKQAEYSGDWQSRQVMIKFVEKYRTAFLIRDISMVDSLFSDQAVIIVGRVMKTTSTNKDIEFRRLANEPTVEYLEMDKKIYLNRLRNVFEQNQDIFIDYSTFKINRKNEPEDFYGISMRQNFYSTGYTDEGYLFLLVDFSIDTPQIYIRAWQPQEWNEDSLIKLANYKIHKAHR